MPNAITTILPDMAGLAESGAWGGIVILVLSLPVGVAGAWFMQRRSSARQQATRQRHARLTQAATVGGSASQGVQARKRASWRRRVTAAGRARW